MRKIKKLSTLKKTVLLSCLILIISFLVSSFCFFIGEWDIPLGILLGGISSIIPYVLFSIKEDDLSIRKSMRNTIIVIILMSIIHILALLLSALFTYVWHVKLFNLFSTFGSLFIGLISNVIVNLLN